jgi:hypothetical protein
VHFVGYLYIINLINARNMGHFKLTMIIIVELFSIFAQLARKCPAFPVVPRDGIELMLFLSAQRICDCVFA